MTNALIYATVSIAAIVSLLALLETVMSGTSRYQYLIRAKSKSKPARPGLTITESHPPLGLQEKSFRSSQVAARAGDARPRRWPTNATTRRVSLSRKHAMTPMPVIARAV